MSNYYRDYMVEYVFRGEEYGFPLAATSHEEAEARLKALAWAKVGGEVAIKGGQKAENLSIDMDWVERAVLGLCRMVFIGLNFYVRIRNRVLY